MKIKLIATVYDIVEEEYFNPYTKKETIPIIILCNLMSTDGKLKKLKYKFKIGKRLEQLNKNDVIEFLVNEEVQTNLCNTGFDMVYSNPHQIKVVGKVVNIILSTDEEEHPYPQFKELWNKLILNNVPKSVLQRTRSKIFYSFSRNNVYDLYIYTEYERIFNITIKYNELLEKLKPYKIYKEWIPALINYFYYMGYNGDKDDIIMDRAILHKKYPFQTKSERIDKFYMRYRKQGFSQKIISKYELDTGIVFNKKLRKQRENKALLDNIL